MINLLKAVNRINKSQPSKIPNNWKIYSKSKHTILYQFVKRDLLIKMNKAIVECRIMSSTFDKNNIALSSIQLNGQYSLNDVKEISRKTVP